MSSTHCEVLIKASRKKITEYERQLLEFDFDKLKLTMEKNLVDIPQTVLCS